MTARKTTTRRPTRSRTPARKPRRVQVRNPLVVHRRKRRPQRKTVIGLGAALVALLGAIAYIAASMIMVVVTVLLALATVILAAATPADTAPAGKGQTRVPPKAQPQSGRCGAPTADGTPCKRNILAKPCPHHGVKAKVAPTS